MMRDWDAQSPPLEHIIAQLVGQVIGDKGVDQDIRILDISGLPNEVAGPLTATLAPSFVSIQSPTKQRTKESAIRLPLFVKKLTVMSLTEARLSMPRLKLPFEG